MNKLSNPFAKKNDFNYKVLQPIINTINKLIDKSKESSTYTGSNGIKIVNNEIKLNDDYIIFNLYDAKSKLTVEMVNNSIYIDAHGKHLWINDSYIGMSASKGSVQVSYDSITLNAETITTVMRGTIKIKTPITMFDYNEYVFTNSDVAKLRQILDNNEQSISYTADNESIKIENNVIKSNLFKLAKVSGFSIDSIRLIDKTIISFSDYSYIYSGNYSIGIRGTQAAEITTNGSNITLTSNALRVSFYSNNTNIIFDEVNLKKFINIFDNYDLIKAQITGFTETYQFS